MTPDLEADEVYNEPLGITHGLFKRGLSSRREDNPLLVLFHGGGTNATYFDNHRNSVPTDFASLGSDVLNINRVGYGGNPVPKSKTPIFDFIPAYTRPIKNVYEEQSGGIGGIVHIGHSLGAATALIITAQEVKSLPILGVSAFGIIPTREPPAMIQTALRDCPGGDRITLAPVPLDGLRRFMGIPDFLDYRVLDTSFSKIFEPGVRSELLEWMDVKTYDRFVTEIAPAVRVPLQYLTAEIELGWLSPEEGQSIFEAATKLFRNVASMDAEILLGEAHNFEFPRNSGVLLERRTRFIHDLVECSGRSID